MEELICEDETDDEPVSGQENRSDQPLGLGWKVECGRMTGMLNLGDSFEFIIDSLPCHIHF